MSTVATYKDFKLVKGYLKVSAKEWVKTGKKKHVEKIRNAAVVLILRDTTQKQEDITISETMLLAVVAAPPKMCFCLTATIL